VLRFLEQKHALGDQRASSIPPPMGDDGPQSSTARDSSIPSSRGSFSPSDLPPSTRHPALMNRGLRDDPASVDSTRISIMPMADSERGRVPELDESPRTIRRAIVSDDED
jgi:hypothetical protein